MLDDILNWWKENNFNTVEDYLDVLENFQIIFTCNSTNIEGDNISYHTTREVFEDAPISKSGVLPRQIFEVRNQKFAFNFIIKCLIEKRPVSIDFIKELHRIMLYGSYDETRWSKGERPGKFKVHDYCVGLTDEGTPPEFVESELSELIGEINDSPTDVFLTSAYFHANFESIHPFADGNGRVGRTLLNYYLMLNDYPPIVLFQEDKETYFLALEVFDRTGELTGMVAFLKEQMVKTWERLTKDSKSSDNSIWSKYLSIYKINNADAEFERLKTLSGESTMKGVESFISKFFLSNEHTL